VLRRRLMAVFVGGSTLVIGAVPNAAIASEATTQPGSETVVWTGHGTMSPGLTTVPTFQTAFTFTTDTVVYIGEATGAGATCNFSGASTVAETLLAGSGAGTLTCSGGSPEQLNLTGHVNYTRSGETLTVSGALNRPDSVAPCTVSASAGTLQPTSFPTVTSFRHQGFMVLACT
jgi:hypothetical protein